MGGGRSSGRIARGLNNHNAMPFDNNIILLAEIVAAGVQSVTGDDVLGFSPFTSGTFTLTITDAGVEADDTLSVVIQRKLPNSGYEDIVAFTVVLGNGSDTLTFVADVFAGASGGDEHIVAALAAGTVLDAPWGDILRVNYAIVDPDGAEATFTLAVHANMRV